MDTKKPTPPDAETEHNTPPATQPLKPQVVDLEDPSTWPSRAPGDKLFIDVDPAEPGGDISAQTQPTTPTKHEQQADLKTGGWFV